MVGQWTFDAYGEVLTAEWLHAFAQPRLGHKGLFLVRLDETGASPGLIPFAHNLYHNRNRTYAPGLGRFLQRDPNQTAMALVEATAMHGRGLGALSLAFSMEGLYGDGGNLYEYLGSNPWTRSDVLGLSWDPFDMVDDYLAETTGNRAAVLNQLGQSAKAIAVVSATIVSYLPIPIAGAAGDLALYALGEQGAVATGGALALGLIPGGKLLGRFGSLLGRIGSSAWGAAKHYASRFGGGVLRSVGNAALSLSDRALRFIRRKPGAACGCFTASTLVLTPAGAMPISEIEPGSKVIAAADDGDVTATQLGDVSLKIVTHEASLVMLAIEHADGSLEAIHTTDEHPFHVSDAWTRADELRVGDLLATISGGATVRAIRYGGDRVPVYNLSIPGAPTYYVGTHGVWVHNTGCTPSKHNYRAIFISVTGITPERVHHRLPQEWEHLFPNRNIHEAWNLRGVSDQVHKEINRQWRNFKRGTRNPTAADVENWAQVLDGMFGQYMIAP